MACITLFRKHAKFVRTGYKVVSSFPTNILHSHRELVSYLILAFDMSVMLSDFIRDGNVSTYFSRTPHCKISLKFSVDKKNQLDVTFCILYFSSNSCSTCLIRTHPRTHYLPTGLDNLPAATAHTNTRL